MAIFNEQLRKQLQYEDLSKVVSAAIQICLNGNDSIAECKNKLKLILEDYEPNNSLTKL